MATLSADALERAKRNLGFAWYYQGEIDAIDGKPPQTPDYGSDRADYDNGYMAGLRFSPIISLRRGE